MMIHALLVWTEFLDSCSFLFRRTDSLMKNVAVFLINENDETLNDDGFDFVVFDKVFEAL